MITATSACVHVKKAFYYIENLAESDKGLYKSTKKTIQEMVDVCKDIVEIGEDILEEESSNRRGSSGGNNSRLDSLDNRISGLENMLETLINTVASQQQSTLLSPDPPASNPASNPPDDGSDESIEQKVKKTQHNKNKLSRIALDFHEGIQYVRSYNASGQLSDDSLRISECIHDWFDSRIMELNTATSKFRYHLSCIPSYVSAIFVSYFNSHDRSQWVGNFKSWLRRLQDGDPSISDYPLPYNIFTTYKQIKDGTFNVCNQNRDSCISCWRELWPYMLCGLVKADNSYSGEFMAEHLS